jgi:hypothetical protein
VLLKKEFKNSQGEPRVILDMPYLRDPSYLSLAVLTDDFENMIKGSLTFMKDRSVEKLFQHWVFNDHEISKMERVYNWFVSLPKDGENVRKMRKNFFSFIREHDRRRGLNFRSCFPMMKGFYQICEDVYNNDSIDVG